MAGGATYNPTLHTVSNKAYGSSGATPTDANALQLNRSGMAAALLSVPLRYMHTPCEVLSLKDVEDTARLLAAYCRRVTPTTDFTPH